MDVDEEALGIFKQNLDDVELSNVDLLQCNVTQLKQLLNSRNKFDTAIMNPPFGTKHIKSTLLFLNFTNNQKKNIQTFETIFRFI